MAPSSAPLRLAPTEGEDVHPLIELSDAEFFERFSGFVASIGTRLLGRSADVDDLVQEVFIAAFRKRHQLQEPNATRGWLAVVTVRTARRQLRRRRLRQFVGLDAFVPPLELPDHALSPDDHALMSRVYFILDHMSVDDRLAWTLRHVEGEKLEDVALRCGCSLATVKRRIAAAHAHLLAEMDGG